VKLNFKNLLKFLIPIFGLAALSGYYRYRYVLNPDGVENLKGELYGDKYGTFLDYPKFVNKCLSFEQDNSAISYGEIYSPAKIPDLDNSFFKKQRVTLKGYGSLINSCRHDVVIERISMTSQIGDSGKLQGILESAFYPNEGYIAEEDKDIEPTNTIFYPDGNILKANSSLKIKLESTDWYYAKPLSESFSEAIPKKDTPINFKLKKDTENLNFWTYSMKLNKDNFDGKKLAEDGFADFRIYFKNPHGKRSIALTPDECIVFINGEVLDNGCKIEKWQLIKNGKLILNSKDFGKYIVK
tara:strand:+ start:53 stop:946 length:894 start_codon:yes stop_codon:yes gene_type:complete